MTTEQIGRTVLACLDEVDSPDLSRTGRQIVSGFAVGMLDEYHRSQQSDLFWCELRKQMAQLGRMGR